ncbi:MAG TPA: hypothetical protein VMW41_05705 [Candidatus Bathyarchaeia archaeon]|nr:hypothetical protein [Candidatus Bathyarchaeia archaeon]
MKKNEITYLIVGILVGLLVATGVFWIAKKGSIQTGEGIKPTVPVAKIKNFEECVKAGNPVLESYPRQCRMPDGSTITEGVSVTRPRDPGVKCAMENCHGLEITCGPNVPTYCTMMHAMGDSCRYYASCQIIDGKCQLVKSKEFDLCKNCIESCVKKYTNDGIKLSECEAQCLEDKQ